MQRHHDFFIIIIFKNTTDALTAFLFQISIIQKLKCVTILLFLKISFLPLTGKNLVKTHYCAPVAHPTSNSNLTSSMSFANGLSNLWASDPNRSCGRCRSELGRIMNRGAFCRACNVKVCKSCREYGLSRGNSGTSDWLCTICYKGR